MKGRTIEVIDVTGGRWLLHPEAVQSFLAGEQLSAWAVRALGLSHEVAEQYGYWNLRREAVVAWREDSA